MLVFFALGNAKVLSFALADAKVPNASSFAFWWNIGLTVLCRSKMGGQGFITRVTPKVDNVFLISKTCL